MIVVESRRPSAGRSATSPGENAVMMVMPASLGPSTQTSTIPVFTPRSPAGLSTWAAVLFGFAFGAIGGKLVSDGIGEVAR